MRGSLLFVCACLALAACGGGDGGDGDGEPPPPRAVVRPEPGATNTMMPVFVRPFASEYPLLNYFDHDVPTAPAATNNYQLTWRGERALPGRDVGYDGHTGTDWMLPENTPLFAVTSGEVILAGEVTAPCFLEDNRVVTGLNVALRFVASDGNSYVASYAHMSRVDVAVGDTVAEGEQIGLSGVTGCVGRGRIPHVHFQVARVISDTPVVRYVVDPYGWEGSGVDPWSASDTNKRSAWLWKPGQAPDMTLRPR